MAIQTFTEFDDAFLITAPGDRRLFFLGGNDKLVVEGGTSTVASMGDGDDHAILRSGLVLVAGGAGADRFDLLAQDAIAFGEADNDLFYVDGIGQTVDGGGGDDRIVYLSGAFDNVAYGGAGNDSFIGGHNGVSGALYGGAGNDRFTGFDFTGGAISFYGGSGDDIYRLDARDHPAFVESVGSGIDTVQLSRGISYVLPSNIENLAVMAFDEGDAGPATLTGNNGHNRITGHDNDEAILGLAGDDSLFGEGGDDIVNGGSGNDELYGGEGDDRLWGREGADVLRGGAGIDRMAGSTGNDTYYVDSTFDRLFEGAGEGTDFVRSFAAFFTLPANVENGTVMGPAGRSLNGNSLDNILSGGVGDDVLEGQLGDDAMYGGAGNDLFWGDPGNDTIYGGAGDDVVNDQDGDDTMYGGDGNDRLHNAFGTDQMVGGAGDDFYSLGSAADTVVENADEGTDTVEADFDYVLLPNFENGIVSGASDLTGNGADNELTGGFGSNLLLGLGGNDTLRGGAGGDDLDGGVGNDIYVYTEVNDSLPSDRDDLQFVTDEDVIDLSAIDADSGTPGNQEFVWALITPTAHGVWISAGSLTNLILNADVDGDAVADLQINTNSNGFGDADVIL